MFLLNRLQCKTVANRCSKSRHGSGMRDATGGIREPRWIFCMLLVEALGTENKNERRDRSKDFSVHFSGCFTQLVLLISYGDSLDKKVIGQSFLNFLFMFFTSVFVEKYNKKDRSPSLFKRFNRPNLPHLRLCWRHFIGSRYILRRLEARVFKETPEKTW